MPRNTTQIQILNYQQTSSSPDPTDPNEGERKQQ